MSNTKNYLLSDKVEIEGEGNNYFLMIGIDKVTEQAEETWETIPTWKEFADTAIKYCIQQKICLSYLGEQGTVQRGINDKGRFPFPPKVKEYISNQNFKRMAAKLKKGFIGIKSV